MSSVLPVLLVGLTVIMLGLARRAQGAWLGPASLPGWIWLGAVASPMLIAPQFPVSDIAWSLVLGFALACMLGALIGLSTPRLRKLPSPTFRDTDWKLYKLCLVGSAVAPFLLYRAAGSLGVESTLADMALNASMARYDGDMALPPLARVAQMLNYFAAAQAGFFTARTRLKGTQRWWAAAWLLPLVATAVVYTTKAPLLFALSFFAAAWISGLALEGRLARITLSRMVWTGTILALLLGVFSGISMAFRYGRFHPDDATFILSKFTDYTAMHMAVLDHWLEHGYSPEQPLAFGQSTLAGPAQLVGLTHRLQGLYEAPTFTTSNVYTFVRPLLEDFGIAGALVALIVFSATATLAWKRLEAGRLGAAGLVIAYLTFVMWSPVCSLFAYTTLIGASVMVWAWLRWVEGRPMGRRVVHLG